jgi:predicted AAA+ superfamily ATPase
VIERKEYLDRLIAWKDKRVIKVITGIRRAGKSTLMELYKGYLTKNGIKASQILAINFEDYAFDALREPKALHEYITARLDGDKMTYVFLDEIQNVPEFERVVNSLFLHKNIDIYLTGSNAYFLSGELATLLSGRYVTIEMLPLSFAEYVSWTGDKTELPRKYREYIERGSFPYVTELGGKRKEIDEYLRGIYSTVVLKDIISRYHFPDPMQLESVLRFIFDSIGNLVSTKSIADTMTSSGRKIDVKTVERYLAAFVNGYIVYQAKRFDIKGKQNLKTLEKYYAVDIGMRAMLLGGKGADVGFILENVIYLELFRRGYSVFVGKVGTLEIDFVAQNAAGTEYYQVAATVRNPDTLKRELNPLLAVADHRPKYLLTLDDDPDSEYDGIRKINALDWLLERK